MASKERQDYYEDNDIISTCGSISGETFASRRSKRAEHSLRQHSIDLLAEKLRQLPLEEYERSAREGSQVGKFSGIESKPNKCFHNYRFLVAMFGGFSVGLMLLLRYNITISILKMVNQTHLYLEEHPGHTVEDMIAAGHTPGGEFNWNNEIQHMIMSWYMVAYTLPQFPATKLGNWIGARLAVPISLSLCAISTLLVPYCAYLGWEYVIMLRLINGLGASGVFPMMLTLMENWMRSDEISLGLSYAQAIVTIIAATNPLIAGYLSSIHWSYSFYVPGFAALVFCVIWLIFITDDPMDNYFVSYKEIAHVYKSETIEQAAKSSPVDSKKNKDCSGPEQVEDDGLEDKPDSWLQVLRVPSFYAYLVIWCGYCSSYSGFAFLLPTYLRQFLKVPIAQNGFYCFIVQSGAIMSVLWPYPLLRLLENTFKFSTQNSRRIAHLIICSMVAATWLYVGTFHEYQLLLLFLNRCFHNGYDIVVTGCLMSNYAKAGLSSVVFSLVNTIGNFSVVFSSTFMGWLLDYTVQSRQGWQMIYTGMAVATLATWVIFATLVPSGPIRFKNKPKQKTDVESSRVHRSVSTQFEERQKSTTSKLPILNNFDKLTQLASAEQDEPQPSPGEKSRESRQI